MLYLQSLVTVTLNCPKAGCEEFLCLRPIRGIDILKVVVECLLSVVTAGVHHRAFEIVADMRHALNHAGMRRLDPAVEAMQALRSGVGTCW